MICPLLSINFFQNQKFSGKQKGSFTKLFVSVLWDTKQFDETVMHPSSYARKFSRKEFFWNTKVFSNKTFWYSQTKTFSPENLDITPFFLKKIFHSRSFLKQCFHGEVFFGSVRKKVLTKLWSFPSRLLEKFRYQNPFETQKGSSTNNIGTVRRKIFNGVQWYPLFMHKILDTRIFLIHRNVPQRNFLVLWDKKFERNVGVPPFLHKM